MDIVASPPVGMPVPLDYFADITSVPVTHIEWAYPRDADITVTFESDLSPAVQASVKWRIMARNGAEEQLLNQAFNAMQTNRAFVNLAAPTQAQAVAQVKALSRQVNALIRRELGELDGTD